MKGGSIVVLVIFVFLFICFVWGIASIVGSARDAIKSKHSASRGDTLPSSPEVAPTLIQKPYPCKQDVIGNTLEHLQKIGELHSQGALTAEEFVQIKTKLIQSLDCA